MIDWGVFWMEFDEAIRDYEERTFADWIDGGYDMYAADDYDRYATDEEDTYDQ